MTSVDDEGAMGLTGATRCSTCHTRGSSRPGVRSGLDRFEREEAEGEGGIKGGRVKEEVRGNGGREEQGRDCTVVGVRIQLKKRK